MTDTKSVRHEISVPAGWRVDEKKVGYDESRLLREYPFQLDPFQKLSIGCVQKNESVLVSAHTSAGKTVVAEYAILTALSMRQKVIYTSPIKALSNQKYRELLETIKDVGLMTGDVTIEPNASCLVMTTEILRNMLYKGSGIAHEVSWIIYDEIHYMRDRERGVVWEESIILVPSTVRFVFLSATIPNALQFADWISSTHNQPCNVVYTEYRPTPLRHYILPSGDEGVYLIKDENGVFFDESFQKVVENVDGEKRGRTARKDILNIVQFVVSSKCYPAIVFSFSRKECEKNLLTISGLSINTEEESGMVSNIFGNVLKTLSDVDKNLEQIKHIEPLLRKGIGIHHSGLLPLLRELVEILFQEGLIKVLFSTETFAIGLNMPAKTVIFTSLRKFDGSVFRNISPGEYVQMSGRAGRRGTDKRGIVISIVNQDLDLASYKHILTGTPDSLNSAFYLSYHMVLNLIRASGKNLESLLSNTFLRFQSRENMIHLEERLHKLEAARSNPTEYEKSIFDRLSFIDSIRSDTIKEYVKKSHMEPFFNEGRILCVSIKGQKTWACFIGEIDRLLAIYIPETDETVSIDPSLVVDVSSIRLILSKDPQERRKMIKEKMKNILLSYGRYPMLDVLEDLEVRNEEAERLDKMAKTIEGKLELMDGIVKIRKKYYEMRRLTDEIEDVKRILSNLVPKQQAVELRRMKRTLRRLGYINEEDIIQLKGVVASEITTGDGLLLSEMIFGGVFKLLSPEMTATILSCFIFEDNVEEVPKILQVLGHTMEVVKSLGRRIADVSEVEEAEYLSSIRIGMMDVVFKWCSGMDFGSICRQTEIFEGTVVRCIRRLDELLRQMSEAARSLGDSDLEHKFLDASGLIRRNIVFSNSLYLN